jgi:cytochrome c-type biogenesis protein CcmH/NrfG
MSGKPGLAVREIKRAIRVGGDTPAAQLALAQMYFAQEDDAASEETYRKLLAVNPDHAPALLGLVRLAARQGDFAEARRGLIRLRQLDVAPEALEPGGGGDRGLGGRSRQGRPSCWPTS